MRPSASSAVRTAPTWPSIIPDSPSTWAPADDWASAISAYRTSVASLSTDAVLGQDPAVTVVGELVEAQVAHHDGRVADLD